MISRLKSNQDSMLLTKGETNRSMEQKREPGGNTHADTVNWFLTKRRKLIQWRKDSHQMVLEQFDIHIQKNDNTHIKINSKRITDLNAKCRTIKLLEEKSTWTWVW